jgi:hypothetical protein
VDPGCARGSDRLARARPQHSILGDQRPVEIAGERLDLRREAVGEVQCFWVRNATRSATCLLVSDVNWGMTPLGKPGTI